MSIYVNLQLKLNQFRVDFALNIDPANNWPSTDSSDQESNFMVHLFNENVVHLTVQIYSFKQLFDGQQPIKKLVRNLGLLGANKLPGIKAFFIHQAMG
jgi:hypothetical protein